MDRKATERVRARAAAILQGLGGGSLEAFELIQDLRQDHPNEKLWTRPADIPMARELHRLHLVTLAPLPEILAEAVSVFRSELTLRGGR